MQLKKKKKKVNFHAFFFFFGQQSACRSLHSFTRLGSKPGSDQKAPLGLMLFVLRVRALSSGSDYGEGSYHPANFPGAK